MATRVVRHRNGRFENMFFSNMAVLILVTVFLGFARTYYLAGVFKADPLPPLLHIHGAVFSSWIVLLIVQTSLVASGRVRSAASRCSNVHSAQDGFEGREDHRILFASVVRPHHNKMALYARMQVAH